MGLISEGCVGVGVGTAQVTSVSPFIRANGFSLSDERLMLEHFVGFDD